VGERHPLFVIGCMRSGTTILHRLLLKASPGSIDLTDDDSESRAFWQAHGLTMGSPRTGTYCHCAASTDVTAAQRQAIRSYVSRRCEGERHLINKNCHLINKIGFVADVFPEARFVVIVREALSVVASTKAMFDGTAVSNEDYPPFVRYWPEGQMPCWWTVRDDCHRRWPSRAVLRRWARGAAIRVGLKQGFNPTAPSRLHRHEPLSRFRDAHADASRYYPGAGFARLPEGWLTMNLNMIRQLAALPSERSTLVTYRAFVADPRAALTRILALAGVDEPQLQEVPEQLDTTRGAKWQTSLSEAQQAQVREHIRAHAPCYDELCQACGEELLAAPDVRRAT
jgi:hypothetical protein